jgi:hypothetical protein
MDRMHFVTHVDEASYPPELGSFVMSNQGTGTASWSKDREALYIPVLRLTPYVIRRVAMGGTLFQSLSGIALLQLRDFKARYNRSAWSYVWGDLMVFETGEPVISRALFLRGKVDVPDLTTVRRYLAEMPKPS